MLRFNKWIEPVFSFSEGEGGSSEDDNLDDESWVAKRGAKNVREELKRKSQEVGDAKALKAEIDQLKADLAKAKTPAQERKAEAAIASFKRDLPPTLRRLVDRWTKEQPENMRVNPDFMEELADTMRTAIVEAIAYHTDSEEGLIKKRFDKLSKYEKKLQRDEMSDILKTLEKNKQYKPFISKYADEIKKAIEKDVNPENWDNKDAVELIVSRFSMAHLEDLGIEGEKEETTIKEKINEGDNTPARGASGVSSEEMKEYAELYNIDLTDSKNKSAVIKGVLAKKKAEKNME